MKTIKRDEVLEYINDNIYNSRVADSYYDLKLFCEVEGINATKQKIHHNIWCIWRRVRDLNPRAHCYAYILSRDASSTS